MTMVDNVGEEQVLRVLERAERIFVSLTGHTHFGRDLSEEILPLVLKVVSAENDHRSDQRCLVDVPMGWVPHQAAGLLVPG
ncbi:hypothetical protein ABT215_06460 [Streptomyces sp900105755]|uniref:hypothetical protein n=1 Tax=Streptomyces sp. 900105755 TaxID=3154389 RepID=UPI00331FD955